MADEPGLHQVYLDEIELTRIDLGYRVGIECPECFLLSHAIAVGVLPVLVRDEMFMLGSISFLECLHNYTCPHLADRCALLLEQLESGGTVDVDTLFGLIIDDHIHDAHGSEEDEQ
jgi:hypothetical protein